MNRQKSDLHPRKIPRFAELSALAILSILSATGCGSQNYQNVATASQSQAPGSFAIAPKVDILMVEDDTGSMFEPYNQISTEAEAFVNALDSQNWNYHFGVVPLTTDRAFSQAVASKQDVNWGSSWVAPYPGATESDTAPDSLSASIFSTLTASGMGFPIFDGFVQNGDINNSLNGSEPAFINLLTAFQTRLPGTGFLRKDAMLAVIFVGNGNDTSYVNFCRRADNLQVPCEQLSTVPNTNPPVSMPSCNNTSPPFTYNGSSQCKSAALSYNYFQQKFLQQSQSLRVYSADAEQTSYGSCAGGNATEGARYQTMAAGFGGTSYDVCSQSLSNILAGIQSNLTTTVLNFVKSYVVVDPSVEPDPTSIQVQKYVGGNASDAVTIPQDATNGWTYIGYQQNIDVVTAPVAENAQSGYMIQLHGSAQLQGQDTAYIVYKTSTGQTGTTTSN